MTALAWTLHELAKDPGAADEILRIGAAKAAAIAEVTMTRVKHAVGLT